jgi:integrase
MARQKNGTVVPPTGKRRSWAIRFQADGRRHFLTLGKPEDGWNRQRAEDELAVIMRDVRLGTWQPSISRPEPEVRLNPTFAEFAEEWFEGASEEWRSRTHETVRDRLQHPLRFFGKHRLSEITVKEVDRYRQHKLSERKRLEEKRRSNPRARKPLSNGSINKTITLLATILELAVEYGYIDSNPAKGRNRRLKESKPPRTRLQREQVQALLAAAAELDREARPGDSCRRQPLFAVLVLAGLRISEALDLRWRDVYLAERKLCVAESKTDTGIREVDLTPILQRLLSEYRARTPHDGPDDRVFPTKTGKRDNPSNIRNRFLANAVRRANQELSKNGVREMQGITPHSLRRTYVSLLFIAGADLPYAMSQAGHADPRMTLGIYADTMASGVDYGAALDGFLGPLGEEDDSGPSRPSDIWP